MCGYACWNCGKCRGEVSETMLSLENVPGYCGACETLNNPTAQTCKNCGAALEAPSPHGDFEKQNDQ